MNSGAEVLLLMMMLVLPLSAMLARRLQLARVVQLALLWTLIFGIATALILVWRSWSAA